MIIEEYEAQLAELKEQIFHLEQERAEILANSSPRGNNANF